MRSRNKIIIQKYYCSLEHTSVNTLFFTESESISFFIYVFLKIEIKFVTIHKNKGTKMYFYTKAVQVFIF